MSIAKFFIHALLVFIVVSGICPATTDSVPSAANCRETAVEEASQGKEKTTILEKGQKVVKIWEGWKTRTQGKKQPAGDGEEARNEQSAKKKKHWWNRPDKTAVAKAPKEDSAASEERSNTIPYTIAAVMWGISSIAFVMAYRNKKYSAMAAVGVSLFSVSLFVWLYVKDYSLMWVIVACSIVGLILYFFEKKCGNNDNCFSWGLGSMVGCNSPFDDSLGGLAAVLYVIWILILIILFILWFFVFWLLIHLAFLWVYGVVDSFLVEKKGDEPPTAST